jgi:hypothetical protein
MREESSACTSRCLPNIHNSNSCYAIFLYGPFVFVIIEKIIVTQAPNKWERMRLWAVRLVLETSKSDERRFSTLDQVYLTDHNLCFDLVHKKCESIG